MTTWVVITERIYEDGSRERYVSVARSETERGARMLATREVGAGLFRTRFISAKPRYVGGLILTTRLGSAMGLA